MSYDEFIKRLNRGHEGRIKGYLEIDAGCLLYLSRDDTIRVPAAYIASHEHQLVELLQQAIREGVSGAHAIVLSQETLSLRPALAEDSAGSME